MKIKKMITKAGNTFILRLRDSSLGNREWDVQIDGQKILDGILRPTDDMQPFFQNVRDEVDRKLTSNRRQK